MTYGSQQGKWAADDICYYPLYKDCCKDDGTRCSFWRGGCQARYLPPPAPVIMKASDDKGNDGR